MERYTDNIIECSRRVVEYQAKAAKCNEAGDLALAWAWAAAAAQARTDVIWWTAFSYHDWETTSAANVEHDEYDGLFDAFWKLQA